MTFNSEVKWPALQSGSAVAESESPQRRLDDVEDNEKVGYHISELVAVKVVDNDDEDDTGNKNIASIDLLDHDSTHFELKLHFKDPGAISKDITFPDNLEVEFLRPDLVL